MKNFFTRNRKIVEMIFTLGFVFLTIGFYYLIYIPDRENEIIERRFRTLQGIDENSREKFLGYISMIKNCAWNLGYSPEMDSSILKFYNKEPEKFFIEKSLINNSFSKENNPDHTQQKTNERGNSAEFKVPDSDGNTLTIVYEANKKDKGNTEDKTDKIGTFTGFKVQPDTQGRRLTIIYDTTFVYKDSSKTYRLKASINYSEFIAPLLRKKIFDHYIVFNNSKNIYEDFRSGISFDNIDSLFNSKNKVYTSRIVNIETGGEKYLMFLHPCGYNRKNDRIIGGLLTQKVFDSEKRLLPENIVTAILFIALFTLLMLPLMKLSIMGKKERIGFSDLAANYLSLVLLTAVIVTLFFRYKNYFSEPAYNVANSKEVLASGISGSLKSEIGAAYSLLQSMDTLYATHPEIQDINLIDLDKKEAKLGEFNEEIDSIFLKKEIQNKSDSIKAYDKQGKIISLTKREKINTLIKKSGIDALIKNAKYKTFVRSFWINKIDTFMEESGRRSKGGKVEGSWSYHGDIPGGTVKEREYFKRVIDGNMFAMQDHPEMLYYIEPVISWTDGAFRVVISKPSIDLVHVAALTCNFKSVVNPVLPTGFLFAVTDRDGNVIFHSDSTHNLNENLLNEFIDPQPFAAALQTRTQKHFSTNYLGEQYRVLAQPIEGLPYFILVFYRDAFHTEENTQSISFTLIMMFSYFIFIAIVLLIIILCFYRQTRLLKNKFKMSWLYPRENYSKKYLFLSLYNSGTFILLALFCSISFSIHHLTEYIFMFLIASLFTGMAACSTGLTDQKLVRTFNNNKKPAVALMVLSVIVLVSAVNYKLVWVFVFAGALAVYFEILFRQFNNKKEIKIPEYKRNFVNMVFSKLLLTGCIPVMVFFVSSHKFERHLITRYKLFNFARNAAQQVNSKFPPASIAESIKINGKFKKNYADSFWIKNADISRLPVINKYCESEKVALRLLKTSRINFTQIADSTKNFDITGPFLADSEFIFNSIFAGNSDTINYRIPFTNITNNYLRLNSSDQSEFNLPSRFPQAIVFWLLFAGSIYLVYLFLKYATHKIFGFNFPRSEKFNEVNKKILSNENHKLVFLQGVPGSNKLGFIRNAFKDNEKYRYYLTDDDRFKENNVWVFDLVEIPDKIEYDADTYSWDEKWKTLYRNKEIKCIVFNHFEYKILDTHTNRLKFNLLEKFMLPGDRKIIISSNVDPVEFVRSFKKYEMSSALDSQAVSSQKKSGEGKDYQNTAGYENIQRWINLLGRFTSVYADASANYENPKNNAGIAFIEDECRVNSRLEKYKSDFDGLWKEDKKLMTDIETEEDCILKIQVISDYSYRYIWSSLTHEEQLVLFDLAEDGMLNTSNYMAVTILINKGLIINNNGVFRIMNRSFRNFILTTISSEDVQAIEKEINDGHTWKDYKYPLLIILGALTYFLMSSNPDRFGNVLPVLSGVMAGIPTILKLLSYLKPADGKS